VILDGDRPPTSGGPPLDNGTCVDDSAGGVTIASFNSFPVDLATLGAQARVHCIVNNNAPAAHLTLVKGGAPDAGEDGEQSARWDGAAGRLCGQRGECWWSVGSEWCWWSGWRRGGRSDIFRSPVWSA
jgi:hypothetical protein